MIGWFYWLKEAPSYMSKSYNKNLRITAIYPSLKLVNMHPW
jgi:hypothetical protein